MNGSGNLYMPIYGNAWNGLTHFRTHTFPALGNAFKRECSALTLECTVLPPGTNYQRPALCILYCSRHLGSTPANSRGFQHSPSHAAPPKRPSRPAPVSGLGTLFVNGKSPTLSTPFRFGSPYSGTNLAQFMEVSTRRLPVKCRYSFTVVSLGNHNPPAITFYYAACESFSLRGNLELRGLKIGFQHDWRFLASDQLSRAS